MKKLIDIFPHLIPHASANKEKFSEQLCFYAWNNAVGDAIRQNTKPLSFRKGKLNVAVKNDRWQEQLDAMKPQLKEQINNAIGEELIKKIDFILRRNLQV